MCAVSDAVVDGLNKGWVVLNHECCIMTSKQNTKRVDILPRSPDVVGQGPAASAERQLVNGASKLAQHVLTSKHFDVGRYL